MSSKNAPEEFIAALYSLRKVSLPHTLVMREVPGPTRIAPFSAALTIDSEPRVVRGHREEASSTLAILYDPEQRELWGSSFRLVGQLRAGIDEHMSTDPVLGEVLWRALEQQLGPTGAPGTLISNPRLLMGTVTRELSESFGGLELQASALNVEIRCSWTPAIADDSAPDLSDQVEAWAYYVLQVAGVPGEDYFGLEVHDG